MYSIKEKVEIIANALNARENIDFKKYQVKYYLAYDYNTKSIMQLVNSSPIQIQGVVYCLNQNFKNKCLEKIEENELINYIRGNYGTNN